MWRIMSLSVADGKKYKSARPAIEHCPIRLPVTLYKEQWLRILASAPEIEAFIRENDSKLKTKV
jgi:hypothetical protein